MQIFARAAQLFAAGCILATAAWADGIEVKTPDGRTAVLYDDGTWEYKRDMPALEASTVSADQLVTKPNLYLNQEVVVNGSVVRVFGKYLLQTDNGQSTISIDLQKARREDQLALERALDTAGFTGSVRAQIQGAVRQATVTYYLEAHNIILMTK